MKYSDYHIYERNILSFKKKKKKKEMVYCNCTLHTGLGLQYIMS